MINDLTLLFEAGLFLLALLTFIVLLIEKNSKKSVAPDAIGVLLSLKILNLE